MSSPWNTEPVPGVVRTLVPGGMYSTVQLMDGRVETAWFGDDGSYEMGVAMHGRMGDPAVSDDRLQQIAIEHVAELAAAGDRA